MKKPVMRTRRSHVCFGNAPAPATKKNATSDLAEILRILDCDIETLRTAMLLSEAKKLQANAIDDMPAPAGSTDILLSKEQKTRMSERIASAARWTATREARYNVLSISDVIPTPAMATYLRGSK